MVSFIFYIGQRENIKHDVISWNSRKNSPFIRSFQSLWAVINQDRSMTTRNPNGKELRFNPANIWPDNKGHVLKK